MRVRLLSPDAPSGQTIELTPGEVLLVGRAPDPGALVGAPASTRTVTVASPLVSGNHCLVWCDDALHARDLGSKNGTLLRLDADAVASLRGASEVSVHVAPLRGSHPPAALRDVAVAGVDLPGFAQRLRDVLSEWLAARGLRVTLRVVSADEGPAPAWGEETFRVPLAEGASIEVTEADAGRTRLRWDEVKGELLSGAFEQVARWRACRAVDGGGHLAFSSPGAARALREVLDAGRLRMPLMLCGETGTGKNALAAIYAGRSAHRPGRASAAGAPPFVTVHCGHLTPTFAHVTLFGALRGSYTSSERTTVGAVKHADGGVLFLDDVDALPLETQAKLLRFLDEGAYEPLGHSGRDALFVDVRIVAGTNADLRAAVRERRFREDLYWRLHMGAVVRVPPLRDRPDDVALLLARLPGDAPPDVADLPPRHDASAPLPAGVRSVRDRLEPEALEFLVREHPWQGNFRECLRFCARVRMEPPGVPLDRGRCEAILREASLAPAPLRRPPAMSPSLTSDFERALQQAVQWWIESEGSPPSRFDELGRFCDSYLKSAFVAHSLALTDVDVRPEVFDRERRLRLGCDLTTLKRKIDDYLALRQGRPTHDAVGDV